jgi:hypothetical protein
MTTSTGRFYALCCGARFVSSKTQESLPLVDKMDDGAIFTADGAREFTKDLPQCYGPEWRLIDLVTKQSQPLFPAPPLSAVEQAIVRHNQRLQKARDVRMAAELETVALSLAVLI